MASTALSNAALVITGVTLFLLGFLVGYFTDPNDDTATRPTREDQRKGDIHKKHEYHSTLYQSLDKTEIGKNLKYVCIVHMLHDQTNGKP